MARRTTIWLAIAALFTLVNVLGMAYAIYFREPPHGMVHLVLAVIGMFWLRWLTARGSPSAIDHDPAAELSAEELAQLELARLELERLVTERERRNAGVDYR